jgi:hypothetical protein
MGAAGVHRDIAADRAGELARRVRGIEEFFGPHGIRNAKIGDARLDRCSAVGEIHVKNAIHARKADNDAVCGRKRSTGKRGACTSGDHLDAVLTAKLKDAADLFGRARQNHRQRDRAVGGERIGLESFEPGLVAHQHSLAERPRKTTGNCMTPSKNKRIRFWHLDERHT